MSYIKNKIIDADIIIFSTPVYVNWVSGSLKNFLDRLLIWYHMMRLAGKRSLVFTTSSHNTPYYTVEYLRYVISALGMEFLGSYHMYVDSPKELFDFQKRNEYFSKVVPEIINKINGDKAIESNAFQESCFSSYKHLYLSQENGYYESNYWRKNDLADYSDFKSLVNDIYNKKKILID